jgi:hypothetical protein
MRPKGSKNVKKDYVAEIKPVPDKLEIDMQPLSDFQASITETETVTEKAIVADVKPEARREFWEVTKWKGVMDVLKCKNCGHSESGEDKKDQMILHVITHFPKSEQNKMFEKLVKEY